MRILLIEDEPTIVKFLQPELEKQGFRVDVAMDGEMGAAKAKTKEYDLIIVDNMLPKKSGLEICQEVRHAGLATPILVLSVLAATDKKIELLNAGADDYLTKPFSLAELSARVRALLRRPHPLTKLEIINIDDLEVDKIGRTVTRGGERLRISPKEYALLCYLLKHRGEAVSRKMILEQVWDINADPFSNTIEAHIGSLRRKIDTDGRTKLIHTLHGHGYKIDVEGEALDSHRLNDQDPAHLEALPLQPDRPAPEAGAPTDDAATGSASDVKEQNHH